jgi:hypothetical protein
MTPTPLFYFTLGLVKDFQLAEPSISGYPENMEDQKCCLKKNGKRLE